MFSFFISLFILKFKTRGQGFCHDHVFGADYEIGLNNCMKKGDYVSVMSVHHIVIGKLDKLPGWYHCTC